MIFTITNQISSRLDHVWLARAALTGILAYMEVPESEVPLLQVALSEVINNTIEHSYHEEPENVVEVRVQIHGCDLRIDVLDDAEPLPIDDIKRMLENVNELEEPDENWAMRGHGLQIVLRIVDSMDVSRVGSRNCITLKKKVSRSSITGTGEAEPSYSS